MSRRKRRIRFTLIAIGVLLLTLTLVFLAGVPLGLGFLKQRLQDNASHTLGIPLHIDGEIDAVTGLKPTITLSDIWLGQSREESLATLRKAEIQFELIPLLRRELRLTHLSVEGLNADLSQPWPLSPPPADPLAKPFVLYLPLDAEALNVTLKVPGLANGPANTASFSSIRTEHAIGRKLSLVAEGEWQDAPLSVNIDSDPLWRVPADLSNYRLLIQGRALETDFSLDGLLGFGGSERTAHFNVEFLSENATQLAAAIGIADQHLSPFRLAGGVALTPGEVSLSAFELNTPPIRGLFDLQVNPTGDEKSLTGNARVSYLDLPKLRSLIEGLAQETGDGGRGSADWAGNLRIDASGIEGAPFNLYATSMDLVIGNASLLATVHSLRAGGTQWSGNASLNLSNACRPLELNFASEQFQPAYFLADPPEQAKLQGQLGHVTVALSLCTRGDPAQSPPPTIDITTGAGELRIAEGDRSVTVPIQSISLTSNTENSALSVVGSLSELPFDLTLSTLAGQQLANQSRWPYTLRGKIENSQLNVTGEVLDPLAKPTVRGTAELSGLPADRDSALRLNDEVSVEFSVNDESFYLRNVAIALGNSEMTGSLSGTRTARGMDVVLNVTAETLDLSDVRTLTRQVETQRGRVQALEQEFDWLLDDLPVFAELEAGNRFDVDVSIANVAGLDLRISDVALRGKLDPGQLKLAELSGRLEDIPLSGSGQIDTRGTNATMQASLATVNANIGAALERRGVISGMDIFAGALSLEATGSGRNLGELLEGMAITSELRHTAIAMTDESGNATGVELILDSATLALNQSRLLEIEGQGSLLAWPLAFSLQTAPPKDLLTGNNAIPVRLQFTSEDDSGTVAMILMRPISARRMTADVEISGSRIDLLDPDRDVASPVLGPYNAKVKLAVHENGFGLSDFESNVGRSRLNGQIDVTQQGSRPSVKARFESSALHLRDFLPSTPLRTESNAETRQESGSDTKSEPPIIDTLLQIASGQWLNALRQSMDLEVELKLAQIFSNGQPIGRGEVALDVGQDQAHIGPLSLTLSEGGINGEVRFDHSDEVATFDARVSADGFDYGLVATHQDAESETRGLLFAEINAKGRAQSVETLAGSIEGSAEVAIFPDQLSAQVVDLWASNVLLSVFNLFGLSEASQVNCAVAKFEIDKGVMRGEELLIDTTRVLILGRGDIDLGEREINLGFVPQSKNAAFFSIATPVRVRGGFDDYDVSVGALDAAMSGLRLYYNLVYVPVQKLFGKHYPEDSVATCLNAMGWLEPENRPPALMHIETIPLPEE